MTVSLLDVNVLLALTDPQHVHHESAHYWWTAGGNVSWATCPITENGFVRVASHPSYPNRPGDAASVLSILRGLCALPGHNFWPDDISIRESLQGASAITHGQVTDVYLVALAIRRDGRLVTLDQRLPSAAVPGGPQGVFVIPS
jgi:toxin-antitoxin system PIN domain toxin